MPNTPKVLGNRSLSNTTFMGLDPSWGWGGDAFTPKIQHSLMSSTGALMPFINTDTLSQTPRVASSGWSSPSFQWHTHGCSNGGSAKIAAGFGALRHPLGSPRSEYHNMLIKYLAELHSGSRPHSLITLPLHNWSWKNTSLLDLSLVRGVAATQGASCLISGPGPIGWHGPGLCSMWRANLLPFLMEQMYVCEVLYFCSHGWVVG